MAPRQNTFTAVPNPMGMQGLLLRAAGEGPLTTPAMTSKQVKKMYKEANRQPRMSKQEQRRIELEEQARIRKELAKDRQANKARIARDKKKAKEQQAIDEKRRKNLPLVDVHPSQDTISRFLRTKTKERELEAIGGGSGKEDKRPLPQDEERPSQHQRQHKRQRSSTHSSQRTSQHSATPVPNPILDNPRDHKAVHDTLITTPKSLPQPMPPSIPKSIPSSPPMPNLVPNLVPKLDQNPVPVPVSVPVPDPIPDATEHEPRRVNVSTDDKVVVQQKPPVVASLRKLRPAKLPRYPPPAAHTTVSRPLLSGNADQPAHAQSNQMLPPTSTQLFIMSHLDELFPSPSQEARELDMPPPVPAPRAMFRRPPVSLFSGVAPTPAPALAPRQPPQHLARGSILSPRPQVRVEAVKEVEAASSPFPFFSTQDFVLSSQDIRDLEQTTETPGKLNAPKNSPGFRKPELPRPFPKPTELPLSDAPKPSIPSQTLPTIARLSRHIPAQSPDDPRQNDNGSAKESPVPPPSPEKQRFFGSSGVGLQILQAFARSKETYQEEEERLEKERIEQKNQRLERDGNTVDAEQRLKDLHKCSTQSGLSQQRPLQHSGQRSSCSSDHYSIQQQHHRLLSSNGNGGTGRPQGQQFRASCTAGGDMSNTSGPPPAMSQETDYGDDPELDEAADYLLQGLSEYFGQENGGSDDLWNEDIDDL